jgi:choloylglycine hydrolase
MMWVNGTGYPPPDARPAVGGGTGWVQYQLDTARSVAEVIASDSRVRIPLRGAPLHYLVADKSGRVATIEFREGKMVARVDSALPIPALAKPEGGDVRQRLRAHTPADNVDLVRSTWAQTEFLKHSPREEIELVGRLPYRSICLRDRR